MSSPGDPACLKEENYDGHTNQAERRRPQRPNRPQRVRYPLQQARLIENLDRGQEKFGLSEPVDFIFDNDSERARLSPIGGWFRASLKPEVRRLIGRNPIYGDDEICMPPQAADLWAWWVRNWREEGNENGVKQLALPWGAKRYIKRTHWMYDEAFVRSKLRESLEPSHPDIAARIMTEPGEGTNLTLPDPSSPLSWRR